MEGAAADCEDERWRFATSYIQRKPLPLALGRGIGERDTSPLVGVIHALADLKEEPRAALGLVDDDL